MDVPCKACGTVNRFNQPYAYHAGFSNQGFLYNEAGDLTLVWSSFDPAYEQLVGMFHPWALSEEQRQQLENSLRPALHGGKWLFANPARCAHCHEPISGPITKTIYYLEFPDSELLDAGPTAGNFRKVLERAP